MIHLLNSANMANLNGDYSIRRITVDEFVRQIRRDGLSILCYIGYDANIRLIEDLTGVRFQTSRAEAVFQDGDTLLIMRLRYRVQDTAFKSSKTQQAKLTVDDFEFAVATFRAA